MKSTSDWCSVRAFDDHTITAGLRPEYQGNVSPWDYLEAKLSEDSSITYRCDGKTLEAADVDKGTALQCKRILHSGFPVKLVRVYRHSTSVELLEPCSDNERLQQIVLRAVYYSWCHTTPATQRSGGKKKQILIKRDRTVWAR